MNCSPDQPWTLVKEVTNGSLRASVNEIHVREGRLPTARLFHFKDFRNHGDHVADMSMQFILYMTPDHGNTYVDWVSWKEFVQEVDEILAFVEVMTS